MHLRRTVALLTALGAFGACGGDHYEGGGRRNEVPSSSGSGKPSVGLGDGMSMNGGTSSLGEGGAGDAGTAGAGGFPFPFPFGGTSGAASGGTG